MNKIELAMEKRQNGYNCAQALVCAYAEDYGLTEETAYQLAEGFGSGMGGLRRTCGAVTGMISVIGLMNSNGKLGNKETRHETYELVLAAVNAFETKNQSSECSLLMGIESGVPLRSCEGCIEDCVNYLEMLKKQR